MPLICCIPEPEDPDVSASLPTPELRRITVGHMPLADAAPLLWAQSRGHFADAGLDVRLVCEVSWASLRDRLAYGALDAAQCLAPMPLAATLGADGVGVPMVSAMCLSRGGSSVTLSTALLDRLGIQPDTAPLDVARQLARRTPEDAPLRLGHVFAYSMHHYLLRDWLDLGGVDAAQVAFRVAPPPQMVQLLEAGAVDGFVVGEPWNTAAQRRGQGRPVVSSRQIWADGPEKVLGVTRDWAARHPGTHRALVAGLLRAQRELAEGVPPAALAALFAETPHMRVPADWLAAAFAGDGVDAPSFSPQDAALRPSQMLWCLLQMLRRGQYAAPLDATAVCEAVCDSACLADAARIAEVEVAAAGSRVEGDGSGAFLAGLPLDPARPADYLIARGLAPERARALFAGP